MNHFYEDYRFVFVSIQLLVGLVFLRAISSKLWNPKEFIRGVVAYKILPVRLSIAVGVLILPVETLVALCHLSGSYLRLAAMAGLCLLLLFGSAAALVLAQERRVPCHCFSPKADEIISPKSLFRIGQLVIAEIFVAGGNSANSTQADGLSTIPSLHLILAALVPTILFLLIVGQWTAYLPELWTLVSPPRFSSEVEK